MSKTGCLGELKSWAKLFSPRFLRRTMVGVMIMVFQRKWLFHDHSSLMNTSMEMIEWSGINALLYYGPTLVRSIGLSGDTLSLLVSGGIGIIQFLAVLPAIFYVDRLGA